MHTRTTGRRFRLQRQTFSIWRPCWWPYWISRLAIIYANLCRQFQKLQTIGNILIYDTSCCTGGGGGVRVTPRKSGQFHSLSPYHNLTLRKHAYPNILKIWPPKKENFPMKNTDIFHIFVQNIDCGYSLEPPRRGGSNEYPQSMFFKQK